MSLATVSSQSLWCSFQSVSSPRQHPASHIQEPSIFRKTNRQHLPNGLSIYLYQNSLCNLINSLHGFFRTLHFADPSLQRNVLADSSDECH